MPLVGLAITLDRDATQGRRSAPASGVLGETALIREAQAGDRLAFEELVRRYDKDVLRLALNIVRRPEDARDIYQEAFLKVYRNLHRFRFECSFYTWVYRIVTNVCLDHMRRRSSRPEEQAPDAAAPSHRSAPDGAPSDFFDRQAEVRPEANPERHLLGKEIGRRIHAALARLSSRERMVFEMKHYQGLKLRVIGEMLGTSEETVKNSLFRATRKLRAHLDDLS
jgi:RNA polymerase sigma-70 factor (ECF subfamily)